MATNIQSQAELKSYLEERLRAQFPAVDNQEIENAIENALGRNGYALNREDQQRGAQDRQQHMGSQAGRQQDQQRGSQESRQQQDQQHGAQESRQQHMGSQAGHQQDQQRGAQESRQHSLADQFSALSLEDGRGESNSQQMALANVREAAISAAQSISDSSLRLAAIASAWVGYAAANALHEQNQQRANRN